MSKRKSNNFFDLSPKRLNGRPENIPHFGKFLLIKDKAPTEDVQDKAPTD